MAGETSQTLDRGLQVLQLVTAAPGGLTVTQIAVELGVSRTVVHRLVATLLAHGLVRRGPGARYQPGVALATLGRAAHRDLRTVTLPILRRMSEGVGAHLIAFDDDDAALIALVEGRPEVRSTVSADLIAAARAACAGEEPVTLVPDGGGGTHVLAPIRTVPHLVACVVVPAVGDVEATAPRATRAAEEIARALR